MKVGFDIVHINRISDQDNFLERFFNQSEILYIKKFSNKKEHVAGFFAAKEAIVKALGKGLKIALKDIVISHDELGKPFAVLKGKALERFDELALKEMDISISHSEDIAGAICVMN